MKNVNVQQVFDTLRNDINVTLGEFAKVSIEKNDYQVLSLVAQIGEKTTAFLEELSSVIHYGEEGSNSIVTILQPEVAEPEVSEVEVIVTEVVNEPVKKEASNVFVSMKLFIRNYIGKRGGKTTIQDLANAFHREFRSTFTANDYVLINGNTPRWQHRMYDQVKAMRQSGIVNPKSSGSEYNYYSLTPKAFKQYKQENIKSEKQLTLPDIEITG